MPTITISDLRPVGSELFADDESYMRDLADNEFGSIQGGFSFGAVTATIAQAISVAGSSVACGVSVVTVVTVAGVIGYKSKDWM